MTYYPWQFLVSLVIRWQTRRDRCLGDASRWSTAYKSNEFGLFKFRFWKVPNPENLLICQLQLCARCLSTAWSSFRWTFDLQLLASKHISPIHANIFQYICKYVSIYYNISNISFLPPSDSQAAGDASSADLLISELLLPKSCTAPLGILIIWTIIMMMHLVCVNIQNRYAQTWSSALWITLYCSAIRLLV